MDISKKFKGCSQKVQRFLEKVLGVFLEFFQDISREFKGCFKFSNASIVCQGSFKIASNNYQVCIMCVPRLFEIGFMVVPKMFQICSKEIARVFLKYFKGHAKEN